MNRTTSLRWRTAAITLVGGVMAGALLLIAAPEGASAGAPYGDDPYGQYDPCADGNDNPSLGCGTTTTVPVTTVPVTTVPVTTVPVTTVPDTTVPVTTVPDTTVPVTTVPVESQSPGTTTTVVRPTTTTLPDTGDTELALAIGVIAITVMGGGYWLTDLAARRRPAEQR